MTETSEITRCPHMPADGTGAKTGWGWVYGYGAVQLVTCWRKKCWPTDPRWVKFVKFRPGPFVLNGWN